MATAYNQIPQDVNLSVEPIFKELMKASIGRGSIYLKAKKPVAKVVEDKERTDLTRQQNCTIAPNKTRGENKWQ